MFIFCRLSLLVVLLLLWARPQPAHAEQPIIEPQDYGGFDNAQMVPEPRFMWFVMGKLHSDTDIDVATFNYVAGDQFKAEIFIPAHDDLKTFSPDIALVGPGLPQPTEPLPFALPNGMGAIVAHSTQTYAYFDIFTQMTYFPRAKIEVAHMPQTAQYYVVVFGKPVGRALYALDIGIEETFAPAVILRYPINWYEVRTFLQWGYRPLWLLPVFVFAGAWWAHKQRKASAGKRTLISSL